MRVTYPDHLIILVLVTLIIMGLQSRYKIQFICGSLSTLQWGRKWEWRYNSTHSYSRHQMKVSGQLHAPAISLGEIAPDTHWMGSWVGPRAAGLDTTLSFRMKSEWMGSSCDPQVLVKMAKLQVRKDWNFSNHLRNYCPISHTWLLN